MIRYFINKLKEKESKSIVFFTFHKCASTLFSSYILRNVKGYVPVDYGAHMVNGGDTESIKFEENGFIYGPIRLSIQEKSEPYNKLVLPTTNSNFTKDKTAIFFIRDPRDILVSRYYSFGYSHSLSKVEKYRASQINKKNRIQQMTIDEYALEEQFEIKRHFNLLNQTQNMYERSVLLKYEDMIENWNYFIQGLTKYLNLDKAVIEQIYEKSRPMEHIDNSKHRRSGRVGGFGNQLLPDTIEELNFNFKDELNRYGYEV